ncbi:DDE_3 domain-containing protein [Trichonephila clavipes]|nr:DDE_3 domain-containing protein [Trichonephila clavipes]
MVWEAIAYDSRSTLIVKRGTLTDQRYVDDILRSYVGPFLNGLPGAIFQQDNARPHTTRVAQDTLRHFQTLPWLARSPDLSPVDHLWDQLNRQMPSPARGLLATDHVILNHGQVTWTTPELVPSPNYHTTPTGGRFSSTDLTCIAAQHGGSFGDTGDRTHDKASHDPMPLNILRRISIIYPFKASKTIRKRKSEASIVQKTGLPWVKSKGRSLALFLCLQILDQHNGMVFTPRVTLPGLYAIMSKHCDLGKYEFYGTAAEHYNILVAGHPQAMKPIFLFCSNREKSLRPTMGISHGYNRMLTLEGQIPPAHQWYTGTSPGSLMEMKYDRGSQTYLARLTSSHLKSLSYDRGKMHPSCKKCSDHPASAVHFLKCFGLGFAIPCNIFNPGIPGLQYPNIGIIPGIRGLGSKPGEDMDVCKCIVPSWHGGTLNSRRITSPLVWLVEGEERWEASDHPQSVLPLNWGEPIQIVLSPVWCSKLRLTTCVT